MNPNLTKRQLEALILIVKGYQNKECADVMGISMKTFEKHRAILFLKMRTAASPLILARAAMRLKLLTFEEFMACTTGENYLRYDPGGFKVRNQLATI